MLRVGLTGGLASGKSAVARQFARHGAAVFDADRIVAELYAPGGAGAEAVRRLFGPEALAADGSVDRAAVASLVFADAAARRRLEAKIHPLVMAEITRRFAQADRDGAEIAVAEASQIFESGYAAAFDRVLAVVAPADLRARRAMDRGSEAMDVERRMAAQMSDEERRACADDVLENAGTEEDLARAADALYARYRELARGGR